MELTEDRVNLMIVGHLSTYDRELQDKMDRGRREDREETQRMHTENRAATAELKAELKEISSGLQNLRLPVARQRAVAQEYRAWVFALIAAFLAAVPEILRVLFK